MTGEIKQAAVVEDLCCFGKCSMTIALPVLAAAGVAASVVPVSVFSSHTGYPGAVRRDLTDQMQAVFDHWSRLGLCFDLLLTGYFASGEQVEVLERNLPVVQAQGTLFVADPAMGDHGRLYAGLGHESVQKMAGLCERADVILPNMTEACLLLDRAYMPPPYTREQMGEMASQLVQRFGHAVVLTGGQLRDGQLCTAVAQREGVTLLCSACEQGQYHGTGDLFASALAGALVNGFSLRASARIAADLTGKSVRNTRVSGVEEAQGLCFEPHLLEYAALVQSKRAAGS